MALASKAVLSSATRMGAVRLTVGDVDRCRRFYEQALGLTGSELEAGVIALSADREPLVELVGDGNARPRDPRGPGLFHLAVLLPSRLALAGALARLVALRWPLAGASDHLVSEALYLNDPEGNGIELYRDRPAEQWPYRGDQLQMATLPLDLENLLAEYPPHADTAPAAPEATRIGHVHLQVGELEAVEAFYGGALGFEVTVRHYPGALFVSAGGYHHHIGLNTWHSAGSPPSTPGSLGLRSFEVLVDGAAELAAVAERLRARGLPAQPEGNGLLTSDPSGNHVLLRPGRS